MTIVYAPFVLVNRQTQLNSDVGPNARLRLYSGAKPANGATAISTQTMLVELVCGAPFGTVAGPILTANAIADGVAVAGAATVPAFFGLFKADGVTLVEYGDVPSDLTCGAITAGDTVRMASGIITASGAGSSSTTPAPGNVQLSAATYSVNEAGTQVAILVTRSGGSDGAASAQVATSPGTATSPADFTSTTQTVNWADGDGATKTVNVPIINDSSIEGNETFTVTLANATGATLGATTTATVTIVDDDVPDTTPPTITSRAVANTTPTHVDFVFSESMDRTTAGTPAAGDFAIAGGTHVPTAWTWVDATHGYLTVPAVVNGETLTVSYTPGSNRLRDLAATANNLAAFSAAAITNNVAASGGARPSFAYGPANAAGSQSVFDTFTNTATPLTGSTAGGKAGSFTSVLNTGTFTWIFIPATADASGLVVADASNFHGNFSGATYPGLNGDGDPADPISVRHSLTIGGVAHHGYRSNGKSPSATYTTS